MIDKNEKSQSYLGETFYALRGNIFSPINIRPACFCLYACKSAMTIYSKFGKTSAHIALIPPGETINIDCGQSKALVLYLNPKWASVLLENDRNVVTDFDQHNTHIVWKIYQQLENPYLGDNLELLEYWLDKLQTSLSEDQELDQRTIQAINMLEDSNDINFQITEIAKTLNLSLGGFCNFFKLKTGVSARTLRLWIRCAHVVKSVEFGGNLTRAAMDQGFSDYAQYSRAFKTFVGASPCTIKAQYNKIAIQRFSE